MKTVFIFFLIVFNSNLFSQDTKEAKIFSKFSFSILGGTNFNTIPTIGGSIRLEGKTNITSQIDMKLSAGFSSIFENKEYIIKTYSHFKIENIEGYRLETYTIDPIQYSVIPINFGFEYTLLENNLSPFAVFEFGYKLYSSEEQIAKGIIGPDTYNNENEIPFEYRNPPPPKTVDDSTIGLGLGLGIKYKISTTFELNVSYQYRYFDNIINTNQILLGVTF